MLAPLAGVSDRSFRQICHEHGCGLSFTEMVSAKGLHYKSKNSEELLITEPELEGAVGIQLFGHEPEMFAESCRALEESPNVCIDINMGCPVPKVVKNSEGSALLNKPELAQACIRACVENTEKPVTVKMRIGFENAKRAVELAQAFEAAGAAVITVHGRTREQYYSGKADWETIKSIKKSVKIPVIGNGDIFTHEDALRMMDYSGVDAVMIARGAMGNPWIFEGEKPGWEEIRPELIRHAQLLVKDKGEYVGIRQMRSHAGFYIKGIKGASELRAKINHCETLDELLTLIKEI